MHEGYDQSPDSEIEEPASPGSTTTIATPLEQLDLASVVKASQALSGELVLERLIERLMVSAVEHAGADRGLLILVRGDEPRVEAEAIMNPEGITVSLREADAPPAELPESMLRHVVRTHETVTVDDASTQHLFSADPYIAQKRCRSVLCLPLLRALRRGRRLRNPETVLRWLVIAIGSRNHGRSPWFKMQPVYTKV